MRLTFHPEQQRKMCYKYPTASKVKTAKLHRPLFYVSDENFAFQTACGSRAQHGHTLVKITAVLIWLGSTWNPHEFPPTEALLSRSTDSNQTTNHCGLQFNLYYLVLFCFKLISSPFCNIWNNENIPNRSDNKDWLNLNWYIITKKKTKQTKKW